MVRSGFVEVETKCPPSFLTAPRLAAHLAVLAGFGPVAAASAVTGITRSGGGAPRGGPLKTGLLLACGTLFCSVPVSWACYLALQPPGEDV